MNFLFAIACVVMILLLVAVSAGFGIVIYKALRSPKPCVTADPLEEQELRRLAEQQAAFRSLQNYSVEDAYGMNVSPDFNTNGGAVIET